MSSCHFFPAVRAIQFFFPAAHTLFNFLSGCPRAIQFSFRLPTRHSLSSFRPHTMSFGPAPCLSVPRHKLFRPRAINSSGPVPKLNLQAQWKHTGTPVNHSLVVSRTPMRPVLLFSILLSPPRRLSASPLLSSSRSLLLTRLGPDPVDPSWSRFAVRYRPNHWSILSSPVGFSTPFFIPQFAVDPSWSRPC